ncbi:Beta-1,3(4)-glucanase precursor [Desulfovibrio sp. DV]|uniref:glycosyl hydrolase family 28-related protein n=1 Tax=Desulfovibrio sp. DV TaxID=1844708 RepID=UPI00094BC03B|nr:glycosyl hydrolase family 28-related protein [Desulfovibrio sp. DV]OLN26844.1 Beta-1,3(4)-glucanase precursor [Desulfovibrio sp. DV]
MDHARTYPAFAALALSLLILLPAATARAAEETAAVAEKYADPIASWDKAGLRQTPPAPVQTVSVRDYGATGDGVTDDTASFESAMAALARPGVLSIPAGTYRLSRTLVLTSGLVLRGQGASLSKLVFNMNGSSDPLLDFTTYNSRSWSSLTQNAALGQSTITLAGTSGVAVGDKLEIEQQNDPAAMYTDPEWNQSWAQSVVGQFAVVTAVSGKVLTLDRPLRAAYSTSFSARARVYRMGTNVGIEDLGIRREDPGESGGDTIHFKYAFNCWVLRVESLDTVSAHVYAESSAAIEVRDSTFKRAHDYGDGGRGYGVSLGRHVSDCLVENNIFDTLRHAMIVSQGANGNVFGYNASRGTVCESDQWTPCDISVHGHYPFRNLFEGNLVEEIDITDYWGPAGPGNVLLRNVVAKEGIEILDASHGQVVLGNVILAGGPLTVAAGITGTVSAGNSTMAEADPDNGCNVTGVPASLYRATPPVFFTSCAWPLLADGRLINPAGLRATGVTTAPPAPTTPPMVMTAITGLLLRSQ